MHPDGRESFDGSPFFIGRSSLGVPQSSDERNRSRQNPFPKATNIERKPILIMLLANLSYV
jgi:hypothetical protein